MKLYRFTAADNHRAIIKVHEALGPDAMIYTIKKTRDGIEVLAGSTNGSDEAGEKEVHIHNATPSQQMIESMNNQIQRMDDNIKLLTSHISSLQHVMTETIRKKKFLNFNVLKYILRIKKYFRRGVYGSQSIV